MTLETVITIQMISAGICTGVCLVVLIGAALDAIMSKKPGKIPQPKKTPPRGDNFIVCACADCVHHSVPAHNLRCCIDRTYITSDGTCISYVPRDSERENKPQNKEKENKWKNKSSATTNLDQ